MNDMARQRETPLILVVDDDHSIRLTMKAILEKSGFEVVLAEDGIQAIPAFSQRHPDMIFLDVVMPGMDGFECCQRIRELPGGDSVPIIMVTGLDDVEAIHKAFDAGATDFIAKPLNLVMLGYRVRYMMRASQAFRELHRSQRQLASAQQLARMGHWEMSLATGKILCSEAIGQLLHLDCLDGRTNLEAFIEAIVPEERERVRSLIETSMTEKGSYNTHYRLNRADGDERIIYNQGEVHYDELRQEHVLRGIIQDVTQLKKAEEQIRLLAFYDHLTGLANRLLFRDRVEQAIAYAERHEEQFALMFLDLDRFKRINDTLGHHIGDLLLKEISNRVQGCIRHSDSVARIGEEDEKEQGSIVARQGGDEFTILLSEIRHPEDALIIANRIIEAVGEPLHLDGYEVAVTTSIGISVFPVDGNDADTLLKNADTAMYHAKEKGRDNFQFYKEELNETSLSRLSLENDLRRALEEDNFQLHYQPQIDMTDGSITGCEALLRWPQPEGGWYPPGEFIPVAEDTGTIIPLGQWVIQTAFQQLQVLNGSGLGPLRLAINISGHQLRRGELVGELKGLIARTGIAPQQIELELTESMLMEKHSDAVAILGRLRDLGVRIAIDDFGTGYSSLSYLAELPVDVLKIDRTFIKNLERNPKHRGIVKAIIAMAESLGLEVVAEGVETQEAAEILLGFGCTRAQGYLYARPLPPQELLTLLQRVQRDIDTGRQTA